jgi:hypothetical protein
MHKEFDDNEILSVENDLNLVLFGSIYVATLPGRTMETIQQIEQSSDLLGRLAEMGLVFVIMAVLIVFLFKQYQKEQKEKNKSLANTIKALEESNNAKRKKIEEKDLEYKEMMVRYEAMLREQLKSNGHVMEFLKNEFSDDAKNSEIWLLKMNQSINDAITSLKEHLDKKG